MNEPKPNLVAQYQTLVVLWAAILMSQVMLILVLFFTKKELFEFRFDQPITGQSVAMILGFAAAAVTCVGFSFAFKRRFLELAIARWRSFTCRLLRRRTPRRHGLRRLSAKRHL